MKKIAFYILLAFGLFLLTTLSFLMGSDWGQGAAWATGIYAILISIFLGLQIYGFVHSQINYSESVEDAKFDLLEREGIWLPCLYCGVDSGPVLNFFLWMIGAGLLAFLCFYGWGLFNGKFGDDKDPSMIPLDIEKDEVTHV